MWRIYEGYIRAGFAGRRHLSWLSSTAAGCGARGLDRAVLSIPRAAPLCLQLDLALWPGDPLQGCSQ